MPSSHNAPVEEISKYHRILKNLAELKIPNKLEVLLAKQNKLLEEISALQRGSEEQLQELARSHVLNLFGLHENEIDLEIKLFTRSTIANGVPKLETGSDTIDYSKEDERLEVSKRQRVNALIHGAASVIQEYFHLLKDELDKINPRLYPASKEFLVVSEAIFMLHSGQGDLVANPSSFAGVSFLKHDNESETGLTIDARAVCFPLLLHEAAKGICEQLAVYGLPQDPELAKKVMNVADKPSYEASMLLTGYNAWLALSKNKGFAANFEGYRTRTKFLIDFFKLPAQEFIAEYKRLCS